MAFIGQQLAYDRFHCIIVRQTKCRILAMDVRQILGLEKVDQTTGCFVTAVKKPCIAILRNGKEHHVLAQWLSPDKSALGGPVGQVRHICLYEPTVGARLVLLVDTPEAITKHLRVLEDAGIVDSVRVGRESQYGFRPEPIAGIRGYLDEVSARWDDVLGRLKLFVEG